MELIKPSYEIVNEPDWDEVTIALEKAIRTCYKSEKEINAGTADKLIRTIIENGHESTLEHASITVRFVIDRGVSHEFVRHRHCGFCLDEDTVVTAFKGGKSKTSKRWTLKQLWDYQNDPKRKGRLKLIRLRSVNKDGILVRNKIKSIIDSGVKDLLEVKCVSGRSIKATAQHRFLTDEGWQKLGNLKAGDRLTANGLDLYDNKEWLYKKYIEENNTLKEMAVLMGCCVSIVTRTLRKHNINKPLSMRKNRKGGYGRKKTYKECDEISKRMTGEKNPRWKGDAIGSSAGYLRANKMYTPDICWGCGSKEHLERHHMDKDPTNNEKENIKFLCRSCHKAFHVGSGVLSVFSDEIVSIIPCGKNRTFDIEMEEEPHNFVANGLVVHNSQESTRYVNYQGKEMQFILPCWMDDKFLGNWKVESISTVLEPSTESRWMWSILGAQEDYDSLIKDGWKPEEARSVLPNSLKTELVITTNMRDWRHMFMLRCDKTAHPQMREVMQPLYMELVKKCPTLFDSVKFEAEDIFKDWSMQPSICNGNSIITAYHPTSKSSCVAAGIGTDTTLRTKSRKREKFTPLGKALRFAVQEHVPNDLIWSDQ